MELTYDVCQYQLGRMMYSIKGNTCHDSKDLSTYFALIKCLFSALHHNVMLADFAPCGAGYIRAELCLRVQVICSCKVQAPLEYHRTFISKPPRFIAILPHIMGYSIFEQ